MGKTRREKDLPFRPQGKWIDRRRIAAAAHGLAFGLTITAAAAFASPLSLTGQVSVAVQIHDAATGDPVAAAGVMQTLPGAGAIARSVTDERGVAEVALEGDPPYRLFVQRLGYQDLEHEISELPDEDGRRSLVAIELVPAAIQLEDLRVVADARERYHGPFTVLPDGMYHDRRMDQCLYVILDGMVIRSPNMMHSLLQQFVRVSRPVGGERPSWGPRVGVGLTDLHYYGEHSEIPEPARTDAWPCGALAFWTIPEDERPW